jgi:hypothetical protein
MKMLGMSLVSHMFDVCNVLETVSSYKKWKVFCSVEPVRKSLSQSVIV